MLSAEVNVAAAERMLNTALYLNCFSTISGSIKLPQ